MEKAPPGNRLIESLQDLLADGVPREARSVLAGLGVSAATLSRAIATDAGKSIARLGQARASHYVALAPLRDLGATWPLFTVDEEGACHEVATLLRTTTRAFVVETNADAPLWLLSTWEKPAPRQARPKRAFCVFRDLPWYLQDIRPQGFLGRALLRLHAAGLMLPSDPRLLSSEHILALLLSLPTLASDLPGNIVIGARARESVGATPSVRRRDYPRLAAAARAGDVVGSSAGGEQAKFTAIIDDEQRARHVLVKFADKTSENGARIADLLVAEHLALTTLHAHGVRAAESALFIDENWCFLETERFDRIGRTGRRATVSLEALDAELVGVSPHGWRAAAHALRARGLLDDAGTFAVAVADAFGALIDNTDRHTGNVSFHIAPDGALMPSPVYDMLPMAYAPDVNGTRPYALLASRSTPHLMGFADDERTLAVRAARAFWQALADESRVSHGLRDIAAERWRAVSSSS
jgi:hypothetical protein